MAIDTVYKRASSIGQYWPTANVDRYASLEEYSGIGAGAAVTPDPVGVPELRRLTMHRGEHSISIGRTPKDYSSRTSGGNYSIRRR
jgi:hypothetical protein